MASVTHTHVSAIADDGSDVGSNAWNATHTLTGIVVTDATNTFTAEQDVKLSSATNTLKIGVDSGATTYNAFSFNGDLAFTTGMIIEGGGGSDGVMYFNVPTGGGYSFCIAGTSRFTIDVSGMYPVGTTPLGRSTNRWNGIFAKNTLDIALGTITTNTDAISIAATWNNAGVTFDAPIFLNVTNTASAAGSLLMDLQVGSATVFSVSAAGVIGPGFSVTAYNGGTISSGTVTPVLTNGNYQYYTNNGAHTLAAMAADGAVDILVTNGASAGTITFSGFTVGSNTGDALTTSNTNKFIISLRRINGTAAYSIIALQ